MRGCAIVLAKVGESGGVATIKKNRSASWKMKETKSKCTQFGRKNREKQSLKKGEKIKEKAWLQGKNMRKIKEM